MTSSATPPTGLVQSQLEFFQIDEDVIDLVRRNKPRLMDYAEKALETVFSQTELNPEVTHYFSITENVAYLRAGMLAHCELVFSARFDTAYFEAIDQMGLRHSKLDFPTHVYSAAYSNMLCGMQALGMKKRPRFSPDLMQALTRMAVFDMEMTIAAFHRHQAEKQAALQADSAKLREMLRHNPPAA